MFQLSDWQQTLIWKELFKYLHLTQEHAGVLNIFLTGEIIPESPNYPTAPSPPSLWGWQDMTPHSCWRSFRVTVGSSWHRGSALHCKQNNFVGQSCVDWPRKCWSLWQDCGNRRRGSTSPPLSFFTHPSRKETVKSIQEEMGPSGEKIINTILGRWLAKSPS